MGSLIDAPFSRVAIVGFGLIGGSIALAVKRRWPRVHVTAIDRKEVVETALAMGAADSGGDNPGYARKAEAVVLAAPVLQNVATLRTLGSYLPEPALVTDVGSTKRAVIEAAAALPPHLPFIGGHPLAGAAVGGLQAARPDLFDDRPWILTPADRREPQLLSALTSFVTGLRAVPRQMDPGEHDRLLAYISHLPQLAVSALMHVVGDTAGVDGLGMAGRGLRDTTRLATSPAQTWRDIVSTNGDNIALAIDDLIAALQQFKASTEATRAVDTMFVSAAKWKGVLEHEV
jgi:prephenate dehydrogenase